MLYRDINQVQDNKIIFHCTTILTTFELFYYLAKPFTDQI